MKVLQLTVHFAPNIGGVETHLNDLVKALVKRKIAVFVLAYQPLVAKEKWKLYETDNKFTILRLPWISGFFYKLVKHPILEFLYLFPGLFIATPFVLIKKNPDVIHAHGLVAGFTGIFWGKIFGKRIIVSIHNIYNFPKEGLYRNFAKIIFQNADKSLALSKQAQEEIISLGIERKKVDNFTYWIDLNAFRDSSLKVKNKKTLGWTDKFTVLFVGRLVKEKGILELLDSFKDWPSEINLKVIGTGPLENEVREKAARYKNLQYLNYIKQEDLPSYYRGSDILIIPSTSEEGFGRVIIESLSCGTPVIGAKRGAIPEAMDETVGKLIDVTKDNIKNAVLYFYKNRVNLNKLAKRCRSFAERRYSEKNAEKIIRSYSS